MSFEREPSHRHGNIAKTGIVLVNLGTPDAPTPPAVRRYLRQFLSDPRVVEIPAPLWQIILNLFILPFRPKASAKKYASIWSPEGSPLKVHTEKQTLLLRGFLGERGHAVEVAYAMRYGKPSMPDVLRDLKTAGCERILVLPLYPQYSGTTTASVFDAVFSHYEKVRNLPELRLIKNYHDDGGYIGALKDTVLAHWEQHGRPDKLVMSFHGVPRRTLTLGDPYHCQCQKTGRLLATALGLKDDQYLVTFQSRFGKAEWLQPYTAPSLQRLAKEGIKRVDVICPGFVGDCLETLEEIAMEAKHDFLAAGGAEFHYIPCLNEHPGWIHALAGIAEQHLAGWSTRPDPEMKAMQRQQAGIAAGRAKAMGAAE
jgi:ferrochelatase